MYYTITDDEDLRMIKGMSAKGFTMTLALQIKLITDHNCGNTSDFIVNIEKIFPPIHPDFILSSNSYYLSIKVLVKNACRKSKSQGK